MNLFARLRDNTSGVAMVEMALGLPLLLSAGLWGTETANFAVTNMRVAQLTSQLADNASRIGDTSTLEDRKIYESDINDLIYGAQIQGGKSLDLFERGRVIISSLEVDEASSNQYIHWQRCRGAKRVASSYGVAGDGLNGRLAGMGPAGEEVTAEPGEAVIFVEVQYDYTPLVSTYLLATSHTITSIASFTVRDSRDLTQIYQRDPAQPDDVQDCNLYTGAPVVTGSGVT